MQKRGFTPVIISHLLTMRYDEVDDGLFDFGIIGALLDLPVEVFCSLRFEVALDGKICIISTILVPSLGE